MAEVLGLQGANEALDLLATDAPIKEIESRLQRYARRPPAISQYESLAPVVNLTYWRQSHPRPIKNTVVSVQ